ncbi:Orotidine 5'-phosphate decarboxylase [Smittium mucronatum]|uniref:Orotidine 5'-phosphate decarboxylase n=1 Tax=Smittium mucronatum TaxID=133383 RepID=A0A1R0GUY7_9FUNG|nr:Orotidine 5'-phosphate decarboxylase [Smittium mucronatum]OLY80697.1 Orotidine 5'-phosphate decarboxylase [Smittium mucronatum]
MEDKKSNLCLSCDLSTTSEILELADQIGPHICLLKLHIDIVTDFEYSFIEKLQHVAEKHNFLLFEDRKFADIGNTVVHQYRDGVYKIASWAHITNAHTLPGESIISGLASVGKPLDRGLLLLAEMSSANNLFSAEYTSKTVDMAYRNSDFVFGFIAQQHLAHPTESKDMIVMTPGVNMGSSGDSMGQVYRTPDLVVKEMGCDIIIVGRGIYGNSSASPAQRASMFQLAGWKSYLDRIQP